jgi:hypothetical protein
VYLKSDGSGYGKLDRGNCGGKPTFSDGQRGGFVNRSDWRDRPDHTGQGSRSGWSGMSGWSWCLCSAVHIHHTRTGIDSTTGAAICRSCWGMITTRSGSIPRWHRPRSAASAGNIATAGSSCSRFFATTSGHATRNGASVWTSGTHHRHDHSRPPVRAVYPVIPSRTRSQSKPPAIFRPRQSEKC